MEMHQKAFGLTVNAWMALCTLIALVALTGTANAQQTGTFVLNKPIPEQSIVCFDRKAAVEIADLGEVGEVAFFDHFKAGKCIVMQGVVTYRRKVHQRDKYRVYEGTLGTIPIFAPTTWKAAGEGDA